jgi:hypothetical protein
MRIATSWSLEQLIGLMPSTLHFVVQDDSTGRSKSASTNSLAKINSSIIAQLTLITDIGIPDIEARISILKVLLSKTPNTVSDSDLKLVASRAHGYVGADLSAVVREAGTLVIKRSFASSSSSSLAQPQHPPDSSTASSPPTLPPPPQPLSSISPSSLVLTPDDLLTALPTIRPSAMRSVFLETPPVKYSDIGGQEYVIRKLREAVEWPLRYPDTFKRLGVRPPKGLLLYGPPGCSKTVLARACASESGVNFVAVKGPEVRSLLEPPSFLSLALQAFFHYTGFAECSYGVSLAWLTHTAAQQVCRRIRTRCTRDLPKGKGSRAFHRLLRESSSTPIWHNEFSLN